MKTIDRLILVIAALITAFLAIAFFSAVFAPLRFGLDIGGFVARNPLASWLLGILAFIMVLAVMVLALRPEREPKSIVRTTQLGDVRIAMTAVENLARRVAKQVRGIKDVEALADGSGDGVVVTLKLNVYPDVSIPQVCEQVERELAEFIQFAVGVPVKAVHTVVKNVAHDQSKLRV